jgi:molybdenum cofactor cytidylyltransferase
MIFGALKLEAALGAVVAHSHRLGGRMIRKGAVLDEAAIAALREAGEGEVIAARMEPGELTEDVAAARLGAVLAAPGIAPGRAATGRVNLHAEAAGLLAVRAGGIDRINLIDESLTLATLPDAAAVAARDMVATVKVIPFALPEAVLERAEAVVREHGPVLALHRFRALRVGLVLTELPGLKENATDGTIEATAGRVAALTGTLLPPLACRHAEAPIGEALRRLLDDGAGLLLVAGASATVDRRDVAPVAIVRAGGEIVHFGMPVDPGNLICLGRIGATPALVLPGCARSPKPNGIDSVLRLLFAGLPVGPGEIMRMGVGGLLKDTDARPLPRARAGARTRRERPAVAAIVLAAGKSTRTAPYHKLLLAGAGGKPMIARVVDNVLSSLARPVLVVVGYHADAVRAALPGRPVSFVTAADYEAGIAASLRAGLAALPAESAAAIVCLGDMPLVTGRVLDRLIGAWNPDEGRSIVVPTHQGRAGNPILWDRRYFAEMRALTGDAGARSLLLRHAEAVSEVEIGDDAVLRDFDTVESLGQSSVVSVQ